MTQTAEEIAKEICPGDPLDLGIAHAVKILLDHKVHTTESCEGGEGHSYCDPTVGFHGSQGEGWRVLAVCLDFGMPVMHLVRKWQIIEGEPSGPYWDIVFHPRKMPRWVEARR
jgi:hypothetical protein